MIDAQRTPWTDVRDAIAAGAPFAMLPVGALEAHGPHLPLGTDTINAVELAHRLADVFDAVLLPALPYGNSYGTAGYPGSIPISPRTVIALATDVGRAVRAAGFPAFVLVNGDWGNRAPLELAAQELEALGIPTLVLFYPGLDEEIARVRTTEPAIAHMNHAEEIETSMVLVADPESVRMDRAAAAYPEFPIDHGLRPRSLHEVSPSGVFGDPRPASATTGEALFTAAAAASVAEIRRFLAGLDQA